MAFHDLEDYKLDAEIDAQVNVVLHRSYRADWARGLHRVVVEERWIPQTPPLGSGSFGTVRLERREDVEGETPCRAVKQLRKDRMKDLRVDFRKELLALTKFSRSKFVRSEAFVNFLGWFEDEIYVYFAMEYFPHGTLDQFITEALSEQEARMISQQLLEGLRIMHEEHFTHRDLKPQNIFVVQQSPSWWVKIGDFGMSKRIAYDNTILQSKVGTYLYAAPEIFHYVPSLDEESDAYTSAVDVWSFACVLFEMLALQPPFLVWPRRLVAFCQGGDFPSAPLLNRSSDLGIEFVRSVLIPHPAQRPSAATALASSWFHTTIPTEPRSSTFLTATQTYRANSVDNMTRAHSNSHLAPDAFPTVDRFSHLSLSKGKLPSFGASKSFTDTSSSYQTRHDSAITDGRSSFSSISLEHRPASTGAMRIDPAAAVVNPRIRTTVRKPMPVSIVKDSTRLPETCVQCNRRIKGIHYHCSVCNEGEFDLCEFCMAYGGHCRYQDHWMVKCSIKEDKLTTSITEFVDTGWSLQPSKGTVKRKPPPAITLLSQGWRKSYRTPRPGEANYDYCFQCRITFPVDNPPHRHEWERHDTEDFPVKAIVQNKAVSPVQSTEEWTKKSSPEDLALHVERLKKMEQEMKMVFDQKVAEKEDKLKRSEEELYARFKEMKGPLDRQVLQLQEKRDKLKVELANPKPKRKGFSLR